MQTTDAKTDQAALLGVALTAILSVVVASGAWEPFSLVVGFVLIAVLAGYYRPTAPSNRDALPKAVAFASVAALCTTILVAYPTFLVLRLRISQCHPIRDETTDECLSRLTTSYALPPIWLALCLASILLWYRWIRPTLKNGESDDLQPKM